MFVEKVKGFLIQPSKTFDKAKQDTLGEAMTYYAVIIAIYSALLIMFMLIFSAILIISKPLGMLAGIITGVGGAVLFVILLISLIVGALIGGAILHIFVYIVGGREGITQTIKAVMYGSTPALLFGWIPVIGFIAGIWSLVLEIIGIRQLHGLTTGKAILAVLLSVIGTILLALVIAISVFFPLAFSM